MSSSDVLKTEAETLQQLIHQSKFINELDLMRLRDEFLAAKPTPHIFIDGMWDDEFLDGIATEVDSFTHWAGEKDFFGSREKRRQADWESLPSNTHAFISYLNQPLILRLIEFLSNEDGLISDPYLEGGGIHSTGQDGFLKLHADFNWNSRLKLYRRINILVYLNKGWEEEFGGQIELAGKDSNGEFNSIVSRSPIFNRTLIFITDDHSYHGQPNPVQNPFNKRRNSIAAYYYQSQKPKGTAAVKRERTDYVDENGKKLGKSLLKRIARKIMKLIK